MGPVMALVSNRATTIDPISPNRATPSGDEDGRPVGGLDLGSERILFALDHELDLLGRRGHPTSHLAEHVFDKGVARQNRLPDGRRARHIVRAVLLHLIQPPQQLAVRHGLAHGCELRGELLPEQARHLVDRGLVIVVNEVEDIEPAQQQALVELAVGECRRRIPGAFDALPNGIEIRANGLAELGQTLDRIHSLIGELFQIGHTLRVGRETATYLIELGARLRLGRSLVGLRKELPGLSEALVEFADQCGIVALYVLPDGETRLEQIGLDPTQ